MWNFIRSLLSNRFGIVLATLNVCYFLTRDFMTYLFSHEHGVNCLVFENPQIMSWVYPGVLNIPALLASVISSEIVMAIFPNFCAFTHTQIHFLTTAFFITFQWLLIGWLAKTIAQTITNR